MRPLHSEMDDRYNKFAQKGVRDLKGYNKAIEKEEGVGKLPQIVIIVDELADLIDRKSTRLNSSHWLQSRMPSSA